MGISGDIYSGQRQTTQHQAIMGHWRVKRDHDCGRGEMGVEDDICSNFKMYLPKL